MRWIWVAIVLLATGCAQIVAPSGGEKDTQAAEVLKTIPQNESTSFNAERIEFYFDEYVQLNDIYNQLLISPPLEKQPEVRIKRKSMILELKEKLQENTTYTFNFGEGIRDVNEGNITKLTYVCSTGEKLDSLSMRGMVKDAFTNQPKEGVKVMLYDYSNDSLPFLERPIYFTRTNAEGNWNIDYLKGGEYRLFALQEDIGNYLYDSPEEDIAFSTKALEPEMKDSSMTFYELKMANEGGGIQYISSYDIDSIGYLKVYLNLARERISILPEDSLVQLPDITQRKGENDTLHIWFRGDVSNDSFKVILKDDSLTLDSLELPHYQKAVPPKLKVECPSGKFDNQEGLTLKLNAPYDDVVESKIQLMEDSLAMNFEILPIEDECCELEVKANFLEDKNYTLEILPEAFKSEVYQQIDTVVCKSMSHAEDFYAKLFLQLNVDDARGQYILEFINGSGKALETYTLAGQDSLYLPRMLPGSIGLRLIDDINIDGEWNTLDYSEQKQAEAVYYFPQDLVLRANWEQRIIWDLEVK